MIALLEGLPLVSLPSGEALSFQRSWIQHALQQTALEKGYGYCWFARELTESVVLYLQREWTSSMITTKELELILKELLLSLRFPDLAASFSLPPPPIRLSLLELAKEAGEGYELLFFQLLKRHLKKVAQSSIQQLEIYDLEASLRYLFDRKRLRREETKQQIVDYIRSCGVASSMFNRDHRSRPLEITIF
jgi:hypothetical protein